MVWIKYRHKIKQMTQNKPHITTDAKRLQRLWWKLRVDETLSKWMLVTWNNHDKDDGLDFWEICKAFLPTWIRLGILKLSSGLGLNVQSVQIKKYIKCAWNFVRYNLFIITESRMIVPNGTNKRTKRCKKNFGKRCNWSISWMSWLL